MTQMDLLVTNVAELLATAVHEVLRLMGQAVSEYRDEMARIRQDNRKLQCTLEEFQKRLRISDAVQQVSSSVAAEEPLCESHQAPALDCLSERAPAETGANVETDPYELSFQEEKPNALHLRTETHQPDDALRSSPCQFSRKRRSSKSPSASPDVTAAPGILNDIKTESEFPECFRSEQTESAITGAHLRLTHHPLHVIPAHVSGDSSAPPQPHVRAENMADAAGPLCVATQRENSHTCHVCGKLFATASSLGAHFICHSGERPFACQRCKFRFSRLADLKKHERIHTGEKPYNCTLCGRRFNRTENLRRHLRKVHHGVWSNNNNNQNSNNNLF